MRSALAIVIFSLLFLPFTALAEKIEIAGLGLSDVYSKEIGAGRKATVKVFLMSAGDPMEGYIVQLFSSAGPAPVLLAEKETDGFGMITFNGVTPSKYLVVLKRGAKPHLSVSLGDIRIFKEGL